MQTRGLNPIRLIFMAEIRAADCYDPRAASFCAVRHRFPRSLA
ncbi:hypothetical protein I547_3955 [Mycobacterium kansasii 824]|uniref:Uncharacterized protein n=1 Tax=Mycobacterium kansasii TaxID=1768 RepID=A0A1V3XPG9_MYCKA|nr:hypothetical protein I547_3955 [Mycobacterium kansasii 824]KEP40085.1 hypothetical protein MKSMC1_47820 [Mycobacterium kansasii]OOK78621.1 hypothetical protein BZL30_2158 [Mycobacterium kansasii]OOK81079.1 hypothetical protein BZL29_2156 [Mycobacterium kansasii]